MIDCCMNRTKARRGTQITHAKLNEEKVRLILDAVKERNNLKAQLANLSNQSLADYLGVSLRTIDRVTAGENWTHVVEGK